MRIDTTRDKVLASRVRYRPLNLALTMSEHDIATGGALMAGALAFRLFLWSLPAALLAVGILGFNDNAAEDATRAGLGKYTAQTIGQAAQDAHRGRWLAVIIGAVLLCVVSYTLAKTIYVATALIWGEPVRKLGNPVRAVGATVLSIALAVLASLVATWRRRDSPGVGIMATILVAVVWALLWWLISGWLPHRAELPWWGLLPGAALVGVGMQLLQLATVYYFAVRISTASQLYGSLGAAATLLLWTYVVARLLLAAAALNATVLRVYARNG
ncbi:MAG TPA: YhjD/YihY/BrkB family envelope integrity protein [Jatrophihabitans sp.]|nr:YhjD/YihY/BrkB family envelope integrity protein [Jatrophihabitans sp.]